eukprot:Gb_29786 [translate_table: standard]
MFLLDDNQRQVFHSGLCCRGRSSPRVIIFCKMLQQLLKTSCIKIVPRIPNIKWSVMKFQACLQVIATQVLEDTWEILMQVELNIHCPSLQSTEVPPSGSPQLQLRSPISLFTAFFSTRSSSCLTRSFSTFNPIFILFICLFPFSIII